MSVLTPKRFAETCRAIYGAEWKKAAANRLERSVKQLGRYEKGGSKIPRTIRLELKTIIDEQIQILAACKEELG